MFNTVKSHFKALGLYNFIKGLGWAYKRGDLYPGPRGPTHKFYDGGGGGGGGRGSYFIPKKITTSDFVYPKKSLLFLAHPKNPLVLFSQPQKFPLFFYFATQKNLGVFHRPQKITFGQNFRPKKITRTPPPRH